MAETKPQSRPLSPHLQVYRFMLTMMMSIIHRITGAGLYFGMALLVLWLLAAATSPAWFDTMQTIFGHWIGMVVLFGFTWTLLHHMLGGIRHLIWDTGHGFGLRTIEWMARANLALSILLTIGLWIGVYAMRGLP
jgi:succinate dehydrogenase / fumarate reductase, cytochrome b subunit